jgi:hypothetical protein
MNIEYLSLNELQEKYGIKIQKEKDIMSTGMDNQNMLMPNNIYSYEDTSHLVKYFSMIYDYGCIKINNNYIIIDVNGLGFSQKYKSEISYSRMDPYKLMNFNTQYIRPVELKTEYDLTDSRLVIDELNIQLDCLDYRISINYFYEFENGTSIYTLNRNINALLLCLFHRNVCVSSVSLNVDREKNEIEIDSLTSNDYRNKNMNKLLRAVAIIIANHISPQIMFVTSHPLNPVSSYILINSFNARSRNPSLNNYIDSNTKPISINQIKEVANTVPLLIELTPENVELAKSVFSNVVRSFECEKGNSRGGFKKSKPTRKRKNTKKLKGKKTKSNPKTGKQRRGG